MLKTQDLHAYYGPIEALKGIDITVKEGQIACLIGSNGAGKTTLLNAISGMIKTTGSISWANRELTKMSCTQIAKFGIMHVPSGRHVFPGLTVRENLEVGTINWRGPFGAPKFKEDLETVITALIGGLQMFDVPQVLTNGLGTPNRSSTTLVMYLNNYLKTSKNYGMSGAISVVIFIITGLLSLVVFKSLTKQEEN